jgi:adenylate kinase
MPVIPHHFSLSGLTAGAKLLCFGTTVALMKRLAAGARSLKIEHVSPELVVPQEICRCAPPGRNLPALSRRRLWTRKPDAGSLLTGLPATLLDARKVGRWRAAGAETPAGGLTAFAPDRLAAIR